MQAHKEALMPQLQDALATPDKLTAFDEFNMTIPRDIFPATGMAARAALDGRQPDAEPVRLRDDLRRAGGRDQGLP